MLDRNSCRAGAKLAASGDNGQALQGLCTGADGVRKPRSTRQRIRDCEGAHVDYRTSRHGGKLDSGRRPKPQQALD
jgi:hypothetical protein